jgi:hypothetical protein
MSEIEQEQWFQEGLAAVRSGDKAKAREMLTRVVQQNQVHEQAWLWLSAVVDDKQEQIVCLQNVLTINPGSEAALEGLRELGALPPEPPPPAAVPSPKAPSEPPPVKPPDDSWRARLDDADYVSDATIVKPMHEPPRLDVYDLANAWASALIFKIEGAYRDEVEYGPAGHILVNIGVSVILQVLGLLLLLGIVITTGRTLTPVLEQGARSSSQFSSATGRLGQSLAPGPLKPALEYLFPQTGSTAAPTVTPAVVTAFGTGLLIFAVLIIITTFASELFQAIVVNQVATWLHGSGSVIPTTQALTIALVPAQIAQLPLWLLLPIVPYGVWGVLFFGVQIYQFLQVSTAVNAAHRLGIFAAMGAVIMSAVAMGLIVCCLGFGLTLILPTGR